MMPFVQLFLALVLSVATLAGYASARAAVVRMSGEAAAREDEIALKSGAQSRSAAPEVSRAELDAVERLIQRYFVPRDGIVSFIKELEARGAALHAPVKVRSVSASELAPGSAARLGARPALTLVLSVEGTFEAVMRAIGSIEYAPYALQFSAVSLARAGAGGRWRADATLVVGSLPVALPSARP